MNLAFIKLATFAAVSLVVAGAFSILSDLFLRDRTRVRDRLREHFGRGAGGRAKKSDLFKELNSLHAQTSHRLPAVWNRFVTLVEQSGLEIEPERILQISATVGIVAAVLGFTLTRLWSVGLGVALAGLAAPIVYVHMARKTRIKTLCQQLPEAFELMSRAVKAGQTMPAAMSLVGTQLAAPISIEFGYCCEQQNLGLGQDVALEELARRTGVMELQLFVVAMLVHRSAGGNPIEILDNLSDVIRKRIRLLGKVKACTSEGRMQAVVLSVMPMVAFVALLFLNKPYVQVLLDRPMLLAAALGAEALGGFGFDRS